MRTIRTSDLNFARIRKEITNAEPTRITLKEALDKIKDDLVAASERGVPLEQLAALLRDGGIKGVGAKTLRRYLRTGQPEPANETSRSSVTSPPEVSRSPTTPDDHPDQDSAAPGLFSSVVDSKVAGP